MDTGVNIRNETITEATERVSDNIDERIKDISKVTEFYIGKSHIRCKKRVSFDAEKSSTWKLDDGINGRYREHKEKSYGQDGLFVAAVITKESIPRSCREDGYIIHQEEYALVLEKRLIKKYHENGDTKSKLANRTLSPGNTDRAPSIGYVIYIAFSTKGKQYHKCSHHISYLHFLKQMLQARINDSW